jgi:predicted MFS family arabinose efflux permease
MNFQRTIFPLGRALAMLIGALVSSYLGYVFGFYIASFCLFVAGIIFYVFYNERKKKRLQKVKKSLLLPSRKIFTRNFSVASAIAFIGAFVFTFVYYPGFFILAKKLGVEAEHLFVILFFLYISSSALIHFIRRIIEGASEIRVVKLGLVAMAFSVACYSISFSKPLFIFSIFSLGISYYVWRISFKVMLFNSTSSKQRGEQLGFVKTLEGIADILGPVFGGIVIEVLGLRYVFIFGALIYLIGTAITHLQK